MENLTPLKAHYGLLTLCGGGPCRAVLFRASSLRRSQSEQACSLREQPPISSQLRLMAMKELPEAEIKVRQDTYASAFNSFISRLFYMSHDPSPVCLFDL